MSSKTIWNSSRGNSDQGLSRKICPQKGRIGSWVTKLPLLGPIIHFNFWWGCTKVADGCKNCYAETLAKRFGRSTGYTVGSERNLTKSHNLSLLKKWDRQAGDGYSKVFAHSMGDVFDQEVPDDWRIQEFSMMSQTSRLWYLILTKRPSYAVQFIESHPEFLDFFQQKVWLGTSLASDRDVKYAHEIVKAPAKLHWISYEPAIDSLDPDRLPKLDWVVIGGESGNDARPFHLEWIDPFIDWTTLFFKQTGREAYWHENSYPTPSDLSHGANPADWPERYQIREFPL